MADAPVRKRAVAASRTVRLRRPAPNLPDEAPSSNYALRLTEALDAISSAEDGTSGPRAEKRTTPRGPWAGANLSSPDKDRRKDGGSFPRWLKALAKLPPIRLPIGPAIPWRVGLPVLIALAAVTVVMSRPSGHADAQAVRLPTPEPYAVQQEAPLFTNAPQAQAPAAAAAPTPTEPALGVQDPSGLGFDAADIAFKLIAVLALAYGSLLLLKRVGVGGTATVKTGGMPGMRVVSSLALAPNRTVHVLKVPGGKTLLVGATPNQVNLIADLGELTEEEVVESTSFFDVLKGKL